MTIEEWLKLILQSNVIAALVVGLFGILTLKLGLGKFRSEKWWERKAATYVNVIEAMHDMYAYASAIVDEANADWELSKKHRTTLSDNNLASLMEIREAANVGPFLMSKNAASIIAHFVREADNQDPETEPIIDLHKARANMVYDAILKLTSEAKRDLQMGRR